ncbi:MAG TPA: hypothetical protein VKD69_09220 [Vicinamibacterales bacterium]|nr:hypothetical protein [Vicinamibacterales bacterium]
MTTRELAIARSVIYASLFDYPLTLDQLHYSLVESDQSAPEIVAVYDGSEALQRMIEYRDGFFFPAGRADLIAARRQREARSDAFLQRHAFILRLLCAVPYTRLVALSGSIAHSNLDANGDLDLFVITRGPRVWTVTVALLVIAKLLKRRRVVCVNFVLADSHLALEQQDLFTANQVIHLRPLIGADLLARFVAANPSVKRWYPNAASVAAPPPVRVGGRLVSSIKSALEILLRVPAPLIETVCRHLYAAHLRRRAASWQSPDQVRLRSDYLKLHTQSHRDRVMQRFVAAVDLAETRAGRERLPLAAAGGRR